MSVGRGIRRRKLLAAAGLAALSTTSAARAAVPRAEVKAWDVTTDVLVAGSGAAGVSAALEARQADAEVLIVEALSERGGSSALSGGVVYAGGGTALQLALGVQDSSEQMLKFMLAMAAGHAQVDKLTLYCEQSASHFDWLVDMGVPYTEKFAPAKGLPLGDESLYFSGHEQS